MMKYRILIFLTTIVRQKQLLSEDHGLNYVLSNTYRYRCPKGSTQITEVY